MAESVRRGPDRGSPRCVGARQAEGGAAGGSFCRWQGREGEPHVAQGDRILGATVGAEPSQAVSRARRQSPTNRAIQRTGEGRLRYEPSCARFGTLGYFIAKPVHLPTGRARARAAPSASAPSRSEGTEPCPRRTVALAELPPDPAADRSAHRSAHRPAGSTGPLPASPSAASPPPSPPPARDHLWDAAHDRPPPSEPLHDRGFAAGPLRNSP